MAASRNGLFGSGVIGVAVFPVEAVRIVSKVDSLGDANFDSGPAGLVSQSDHVDVVADPRSVEREGVVKGRILTFRPLSFFTLLSFGYLREVSVFVGKGVGNSLPALVGMVLDCAVGNSQLVSAPWPCLDVDSYNREEALICTPLKSCPPALVGKYICLGLEYSDWVWQRVREIYRVVGLSREANEKFMSLLTAIERAPTKRIWSPIPSWSTKVTWS